jgi:S-DNA-T family DNA segregation ATPase FtsK/SpoIIIE
MGAKKRNNRKSKKRNLEGWLTGAKDFKFRFVSGFILASFSFYLALAFLSFFFTGFADKSKFDIDFWEFIKSADIQVENWTGKFGAWMADTLINDWFGIASFSVVILLFLGGLKLLGAKIVKFSKAVMHASLITIWLSLTLGFFFIDSVNDQYLLLGGAHGFFLSRWLSSAVGWAGTFILILVAIVSYFSFCFDWFVPLMLKPFTRQNQNERLAEKELEDVQNINADLKDENDLPPEAIQHDNLNSSSQSETQTISSKEGEGKDDFTNDTKNEMDL